MTRLLALRPSRKRSTKRLWPPPSTRLKPLWPRRPASFSTHWAGAGRASKLTVAAVRGNVEELLAPGRDPKRSTLFVQLLVALARATGGHLCVLAACRDDALSALQTAHPALADLIQNNRVELTPMTLEDLRQAIEQPAQRAGYIFEPGLLNRLLGDFAPDTRSLALLQIVLLELHRHAREGVLTNEAYDRLGGVAGSSSNVANRCTQA